jgi:hypothetical protein
LLAMLLDDFYQETFHAPVVPPASEEHPEPQRHSSRPRPHSENEGGRDGSRSGRRSRNRRPR